MAYSWLQFAERIIKDGRSPASLSECLKDRHYCACNLLPDLFYEQAAKENKRWFCSEKNFRHIAANAKLTAVETLRVIGAERYPLTLAHFAKA